VIRYRCNVCGRTYLTRASADGCLDWHEPDPATYRSAHGSVPSDARFCGDCGRPIPDGRALCPCNVVVVEVAP